MVCVGEGERERERKRVERKQRMSEQPKHRRQQQRAASGRGQTIPSTACMREIRAQTTSVMRASDPLARPRMGQHRA